MEETIVMPGLLGYLLGMLVTMLFFALVSYVYFSFTLMRVAQRVKEGPAWLAWIPIVNVWLFWKVSGTPSWSFWLMIALFILSLVKPLAGLAGLGLLVLSIWWLWATAERVGKTGWLVLLFLIPVLGPFIYWGILAWSK